MLQASMNKLRFEAERQMKHLLLTTIYLRSFGLVSGKGLRDEIGVNEVALNDQSRF